MRPGSASYGGGPQQGLRPGSAARVPTAGGGGRLGTGLAGGGAGGRPLSTSGGPRASTPGAGGRQVQDASYFVGVIRARVEEIAGEIRRMRAEAERAARDGAATASLERRYEAALAEVRSLEGDLADYNLAMDKARSGVEPGEIGAHFAAVRRRNEAAVRDADALFLERAERERGAARLEEAIAELGRAAEARIGALPPAAAAEYRSAVEAARAAGGAVARLQADLAAVNAAIESAEEALRRDRSRDEHAALGRRVAALARERASLAGELEATRLDPAAAREALLGRVREDNARLAALDRQLAAAEDANAERRRAVAELAAEIEERRGEAGDSAKYEALFKRDQEMTEFIDRFPDTRAREAAEQRAAGDRIVALLEHIAEGVAREGAMPSAAAAAEMKEDLADKAGELRASEATAGRLRDELALRQAELDKVATLEDKIAAELEALGVKMGSMRDDVARFGDLPGLRAAAEAARAAHAAAAAAAAARRDAVRPALAAAAAEYERARAALAREPEAAAIAAAEERVRAAEGAAHAVREFVAAKGAEADYAGAKADALRLAAEVNLGLQRAVSAAQ